MSCFPTFAFIQVLFLFFVFFILLYFSVTIYPPYTPLPTTITTLFYVSMSPFSLLLKPSTPTSSHLSFYPALYESLSIFLVSSVCSLETTYE